MKTNPLVDDYIANAAPFAQPILSLIRAEIHRQIPEIEEEIKWRAPHFVLNGQILCAVMAFKHHINFMFWKGQEMDDPHGLLVDIGKSSMKGIKEIKSKTDLPNVSILREYLQNAQKLIDQA